MEAYDTTATILVGPQQTKFIMSMELLLMRSQFFRAALTGNFVEARERVVKLPEVNIRIFRQYTRWLYSGDFVQDIDHVYQNDEWKERLWLFVFAEQTLTERLQNQIIDGLALDCYEGGVDFDAISAVWDRLAPESKMRKFLLDYCVELGLHSKVLEHAARVKNFNNDFIATLGNRSSGRPYVDPNILPDRSEWKFWLSRRCPNYHSHHDDYGFCHIWDREQRTL